MMRKQINFMIALFFLTLFPQQASAQDTRELNALFCHKNYALTRTIVQLFNPKGEFIKISRVTNRPQWHTVDGRTVSRDSTTLILTIGCDNSVMTVNLDYAFKPLTFFYDINVVGDEVTTPSVAATKALCAKMAKAFKKEEIAWVEKKMGKSLSTMNGKEIFLAYLTLQYWKTDIVEIAYN